LVGPRLIELCFQTAGVWEIGKTGQLALPTAVDQVIVRDPSSGNGPLVAEVTADQSADGLSFSARVRDGEGKVHVELAGLPHLAHAEHAARGRSWPVPQSRRLIELPMFRYRLVHASEFPSLAHGQAWPAF
jgi:hypothetical protein